jgi:hypothetical protein
LNTRLMNAFDFTEADLEANRESYLSENQLAKFRADTRETLAVFRFILFLLPVLGVILLLFGIYNDLKPLVLTVISLFSVVEFVAFFLYKSMQVQTKRTLKSGELTVLEGNLWMRTDLNYKGRGSPKYQYSVGIGSHSFTVTESQFDLFTENAPYILCTTSGKIWSCERLYSEE